MLQVVQNKNKCQPRHIKLKKKQKKTQEKRREYASRDKIYRSGQVREKKGSKASNSLSAVNFKCQPGRSAAAVH